jgi:predicted nucleic acid-binding Zn ribbon protein
MKKGFATPAVHFKGSGWAKKDRKATSVPGKSKAAPATDAASSEQKTPTPAPDGPSAPSADGGSD